MGKAPAIQLYVGDYIKDTRMLSLAARGAWSDWLMFMWSSVPRGVISGTYEQLARQVSASEAEVRGAITELKSTKVADVTECNGIVTLMNRRMLREEKERISTRFRVQRFRNAEEKRNGNENVTPPSYTSSYTSSSNLKQNTSTDEPLTSPDPSKGNGKIPYDDFIAAFLRCCPSLPKPLKLTKTRQRWIKRAWDDHPDWQFWESFWAIVERSDFLTGRSGRADNHKNFKAGLDWFLKSEDNFAKTLEGNYDNR